MTKTKPSPITKITTSPESPSFTNLLTDQLMQTVYNFGIKANERDQKLAIESMMADIKPRDVVEHMIAAQLVAIHNAIMKCSAEIMAKSEYKFTNRNNLHKTESLNLFMRSISRLIGASNSLIEALNRYRGKYTEQKITVQYVNVSEGGQAIIGNVKGGGETKTNG